MVPLRRSSPQVHHERQAEAVCAQLERLIARTAFKSSRRCQVLLIRIVEHAWGSTTAIQLIRANCGSTSDWQSKSLQMVLETQIVDGDAGPPRVVASRVW